MTRPALWLAGILLLILGMQNPAAAHLTPNTDIMIAADDRGLDAEIAVSVGEWRYAYGASPMDAAAISRHFAIATPDGRPWKISAIQVSEVPAEGGPDFRAWLRATPPSGAPLRQFTLRYTGIIDQIASHTVLVSARSDFRGGVLASSPRLFGGLQSGRPTLAVDLGKGSQWQGFAATFRLGMHHIAEGFDHLAFLFVLLLPASLVARAGLWQEFGGARRAVRHLLGVITAFTIGHSLTLIGGAWFGWTLPVKPVELGIAASVLISAIHAARPLFPGREMLVAGGFGLVHGLAFATIIADFALPPVDRGLAILGFNLGIEAVQIAIAVAVMPILILWSRHTSYGLFRLTGATAAGIAALVWVTQRL